MNPELEKELAEASGEAHWRTVRPLELNEVSLNGYGGITEIAPGKFERKGGFFRKRILAGHRDRNQKPEELNLGASIKIIFLRKRRKLVERGEKGKIVRSTNEHNATTDAVTLYHAETNTSENGVAKDLRTKYGNLRTVEIVYALLITNDNEPELVRLIVKGSSLGSEVKADTTTDLYQYLSGIPAKVHAWQYYTILTPVLEQGQQPYYAIDFKPDDRLDETFITEWVAPALRKVKENCEQVDASRAAKIVQAAQVEKPEEDFDLEQKQPDDQKVEIDPDSIPF